MIQVTGDCILKKERSGLREKIEAAAVSIPAGNERFISPPKMANDFPTMETEDWYRK